MNNWKMKLLSLVLALWLALAGCAPAAVPEPTRTPALPENESDPLVVHFIDVGQADCILLESKGETLLIDGGNREDGSLVVSYLEQMGIDELDTVICTHAHEDHVGGLPSVLAVYPVGKVYCPTKTYSSKVFDSFLYYVDQQGLEVTLPEVGEEFYVGGANVKILGPVKTYADPNDTSIVVKVDYGMTEFLFTGDMETGAENDMLDYWDDDTLFQADVLKMGHHGSSTSSSYRLLNAVEPKYAVISVGKDNDYGHPHTEPMERLKQAGIIAMRTDELGTIVAQSDGLEIEFTWGNQNAEPEDVEQAQPVTFIGNKNSKIFHADSCSSLPAEKNRVYFDSYSAAEELGYKPCSGCLG